jgi:hypothetical protein
LAISISGNSSNSTNIIGAVPVIFLLHKVHHQQSDLRKKALGGGGVV